LAGQYQIAFLVGLDRRCRQQTVHTRNDDLRESFFVDEPPRLKQGNRHAGAAVFNDQGLLVK